MLISVKENLPPLGKKVLLMRENLGWPIPVYLEQETVKLSHVSPGSDKVEEVTTVTYNWVALEKASVEKMLENDYWMSIPKVLKQPNSIEEMKEDLQVLSDKLIRIKKTECEFEMTSTARQLLHTQINIMRVYHDILCIRLLYLRNKKE